MPQRTPLKGALIGCGFVSQHHIEAWKQVEGAELVALCDLDPARLAVAQSRLPSASAFLDAEQLFAAHKLDFVEICTGPESHRALTELAAHHGAHVLCQKPSALDRADLLAMIHACERAGVRLMIHENWRFRPWYRVLQSTLRTGLIGRPIRLRLSHRDTRALRPEGFRDQPFFEQMPRLILMEMGPHIIDVARFLLGEITEISARLGHFGGHLGEDLAMLTLGFASGAVGFLDLSWCAPADVARPEWALNETVVEGTLGAIKLRPDGQLERIDLEGACHPLSVPLPAPEKVYLDAYIRSQEHFLHVLTLGSTPETDGFDNLKTMDVLWAGYESARSRSTVFLHHH